MSEETKKTPQTEEPAVEPNTAEQAAPETAPEQAAAPETNAEAADPKKKDGFFNKKARELEAVKAKLDAAEKNANQAKDQLLRMAAEYENYRKRSTREADQKFNDGVSFAVNQIIPILDTLDMAANAPTTDENYKKGVTMTLDKAAKALSTLHVEEIEALGKPFDPNFMNAVQQIPAPDGQESGTVITVPLSCPSGAGICCTAFIKLGSKGLPSASISSTWRVLSALAALSSVMVTPFL